MSTRIKETDPALEQAFAVADALQASRQPLHQGLRLGDIIEALTGVDRDMSVEFDFGGLSPTKLDSYRGYYSDLALGYSDDYGATAGSLLDELTKADGAVFEGYKGGEYRMNRQTPIWVANYGRSHGVAIVAVEVQSWRVLLRTALID